MTRFVFILATALLCSNPSTASSTDEEFAELPEQFVNDFSRFSPVSATMIGDHSADHELDQVDAAARTKTRALYIKYRDALAAIDREKLLRPNQVDAELLHNEIESSLWALETV